MTPTPTIRDAILDVTAAVSDGLASVVAALSTGTQTTADIRRTSAVFTDAAAQVRTIRRDLDGYDPVARRLYPDAALTLTLWQWERAQRWGLAGLDANIRDGRSIAMELLQGRGLTLHAVRAGETLQSIAAKFLGDWREWPRIAEANGLAVGASIASLNLIIPTKV
jgi:nucleoid-associated protein YgaU